MQDLKINLIQCFQQWEDKGANFEHFDELLQQQPQKADLIVFPEMFQTGFSMHPEKLAETMNGESIQWLKNKAKQFDSALAASLMIEENGQYFNRMVFIEPSGRLRHYDKRKLFSYADEEQHFTPGKEFRIVRYKNWHILLQVCYDLRFPKMSANKVLYGKYDYDLLLNVANWPAKRNLHWKTLLRARAIENQSYVVGVNRMGEGNGLAYSGDSCCISPAGDLLESSSDEEKIIPVILPAETLTAVRVKMPFLKDR